MDLLTFTTTDSMIWYEWLISAAFLYLMDKFTFQIIPLKIVQ